MMRNIQALTYPARFKLDEDNYVLVTFRDLPRATDGANYAEALTQAVDFLESSLAHLVHDEMDIPSPSAARRNEILVSPSAVTAAQVALYMAMRREKVSAKNLAKRLGLSAAEVRYLIDLANYPPVEQIERAFGCLGSSPDGRSGSGGVAGAAAKHAGRAAPNRPAARGAGASSALRRACRIAHSAARSSERTSSSRALTLVPSSRAISS